MPLHRGRSLGQRAFLILCALVVAPLQAQEAASDKKALLDQLLAAYAKYELPLPPKDAPLVRCVIGETIDQNERRTPLVALGFLTNPPGPDHPAKILVGTRLYPSVGTNELKVVKPERDVADDIQRVGFGHFQTNACLAVALQCHSRGFTDLAVTLYDLSAVKTFEHEIEREDYDRPGTPLTEVAFLAWSHRANDLFLATTDRSQSLRLLKALMAAEPRLKVKANEALVASLEASLLPSNAKPGTVEARVDDLIDLGPCDLIQDPPRRALALIELGFDAVPNLLAHLEDRRLTRHYPTGLGSHFPEYPWTLGGICSDLIRDLAGWKAAQAWDTEDHDPLEWDRRAREWFKQASLVGEERFLLENALLDEDWPNRYILRVLSKKYPARLGDVYGELLEKHPTMNSWPLATELASSGVARDQKIDLLAKVATRPQLKHRIPALGALRTLESDQFIPLLVDALETLPSTTTEPYGLAPEALIGSLVAGTPDPRAWKALGGAARRAEVGLRLELLSQVDRDGEKGDVRKEQIAFLAGFLSDDSLRDAAAHPKEYAAFYAARQFRRIEVRNYVAMKLASILGLGGYPEPDRSPEEWADLRDRVKQAISK